MRFPRAALYEHDRTWAWKAFLRAIAVIFDIVGIGLTGWALAQATKASQYVDIFETTDYFSWGDYDLSLIPWNLITFSLSFIWCLTNLCILLFRTTWIHPGANVGVDLLLWLSFIVTALWSTAGTAQDLYYDGSYGYDYYSDTYDNTTYAYYPNGTSYEVTPSQPAPPCPGFSDCAVKSAFLSSQHSRGLAVAVATGLAWVLMLMHFALLVSACRYTHERRRERLTAERLKSEAEKTEARIIRRLEAEGRLRTPPPQEVVSAAPEMTLAGGSSEGTSGQQVGYGQGQMPLPQIRVDPATEISVLGANQHYVGHEGPPAPSLIENAERPHDGEGVERISYA